MSFGPIHIDHIGIAAHRLDDNSTFWRLIGLVQGEHDETVEDQGVTTRFFSTSSQNDEAPLAKLSYSSRLVRTHRLGSFFPREDQVFSKFASPLETLPGY